MFWGKDKDEEKEKKVDVSGLPSHVRREFEKAMFLMIKLYQAGEPEDKKDDYKFTTMASTKDGRYAIDVRVVTKEEFEEYEKRADVGGYEPGKEKREEVDADELLSLIEKVRESRQKRSKTKPENETDEGDFIK